EAQEDPGQARHGGGGAGQEQDGRPIARGSAEDAGDAGTHRVGRGEPEDEEHDPHGEEEGTEHGARKASRAPLGTPRVSRPGAVALLSPAAAVTLPRFADLPRRREYSLGH